MKDEQKTKQQLIDELVQLRKRASDLEMQLASSQQADAQASEAKYRRLYQTMRDAFVNVDMDGRIQEFNDAYCQMLGYEPDDLPALTYIDITPEKWHAFEAEIVRDQILPLGYSRTYEKEYRRKDGTVFPVELRTCLISGDDGKPYAMWAIVRDITERKQTEKALQEANERLEQRVRERTAELTKANEELGQSEARYKALVESSPDAVLMCDLKGRITFASPQVAERHGIEDASDLIGQATTDLVVEQERTLMQLNIRDLFESGIRRNDQYTGLRMDGTTFFAEVSSSVITGVSGETESFMAVYQDITERKLTQEALVKERQTLRQMLQASDHDRELITYELHDGVAQRLAGALMYFQPVSKLISEVAEQAGARFDAGLTLLREASAEARGLMNRTRTPVLQKFGVIPAIADFIDQFIDRPNSPEITYHCEARFGRLEPVLENTIFRVAQEAITNACIHSKSDIVRVTLIQSNREVTIEVQDSGIGFDVTHAKEDSFGLLGIRERTRLLGKELIIESKPGQGTRIQATFPLVYREEEMD